MEEYITPENPTMIIESEGSTILAHRRPNSPKTHFYVEGNQLGEGNYSYVMKMVDVDSGQVFAGSYRLARKSSPDAIRQELELLNLFKGSPYIVQVHSQAAISRGGGPARTFSLTIYNYYNSNNLDYCMRKYPFSDLGILQVAVCIAAGLKEIHSKGVVHRDIKPANILLGTTETEGVVAIADFGLACYENDPKVQHACGTPNFLAPELLYKTKYRDLRPCHEVVHVDGKAADIFSLGMLYKRMFRPDADKRCLELIERMLSLESSERPSIADVFDIIKALHHEARTSFSSINNISVQNDNIIQNDNAMSDAV